jgi:hypothetical protein
MEMYFDRSPPTAAVVNKQIRPRHTNKSVTLQFFSKKQILTAHARDANADDERLN